MDDDSAPLSNRSEFTPTEIAAAAKTEPRSLIDVLYWIATEPDTRVSDRSGYDPRSETYHAKHDWDDSESLSTTVIRAVEAATDTDPVDMEPLYERLDPDALNALFSPRSADGPHLDGQIVFSLDGRDVAVHSSGHILVDVSDIEEDDSGPDPTEGVHS